MSQLQNIPIALGTHQRMCTNSCEPIFIIEASGHGQIGTPVVDYSNHTLWMTFGLCWLLIGISSYFKQIFYSFVFEQYKAKEFKPIDLMSLLVATVQHTNIIVFAIKVSLRILLGTTTAHLAGGWFCSSTNVLHLIDVVYMYIGGLGIAIYRVLLVKYGTWIKLHVGEKTTLYAILCGGFIITISVVIILCSNDYVKILIGQCMRHPHSTLLQVLDAYEQSRNNFSVYSRWSMTRRVLAIIMIIFTTTEIVLYIILFHFIYKKDNSEALRRLLEPRCIRQRNTTNAITFFGQFCSFVIELTYSIYLISNTSQEFSFNDKGRMDFGLETVIIRTVGFTTISIVEVLTSKSLRSRLLKKYLLNKHK